MNWFFTKINSTVLANFRFPAASLRLYFCAVVASAALPLVVYCTRMGQSLTRSEEKTDTGSGTKSKSNKGDSNAGNGSTPLLQLAMEGNIDSIKAVIAQHCTASSSDTAIDITTSTTTNNVPEQKEKIQSFVNQSDSQGNTPLHGAIFSGHLPLVQYLVNDCGADISLKNGMGCSPLWIAAGYGHAHVLRYLIETIRARQDDEGQGLICMLREVNNTHDTPLLAAVSKGHVDVSRIILQSANDNDNDNELQQNAVETAICYEMLCESNKAGDTPLAVCVGSGHDGPLLNLLLDWEEKQLRRWEQSERQQQQRKQRQQQRPLNHKNPTGLTPLLVACERNLAPVVEEFILRRGASTSICDEKGMSPLAVAAFCGCEDVVRKIISIISTDGDSKEKDDHSHEEGYATVLGKDILDQADGGGCTPLWLAARTGNAKMVQILVEAGADVTIKNNSDELTPEEAAIRFKKAKVIEFFRQLST